MNTVFILRFDKQIWGPYLSHSQIYDIIKYFNVGTYVVEEWFYSPYEKTKVRELIEVQND